MDPLQHQQLIDEGPLPPGWTLTGLPSSMTLAFRQRAVHRIATRFIPMLRHRRNLRLKRQQAQSKIKMAHKDIVSALRATGSPLFTLAGESNADSIIDMCIEEGTLSSHSTLGEIVVYAGEPCAPCAWFLVRGRLDQFQGAVSWHSPNLSTKQHNVFPTFEHMCRKSYVYRHTGSSSNSSGGHHHHHHHQNDSSSTAQHNTNRSALSSATTGLLHSNQNLNKSNMSATSSNTSDAGGGGGEVRGGNNGSTTTLSRKPSFAGSTTGDGHHNDQTYSSNHNHNGGSNHGNANNSTNQIVGGSSSSATHQSSSASASTETLYTCTAKGGLSRYIHGRRGGSEIRAPKCLSDLATVASYHFTSFFTVPLSSFDPSAPSQHQKANQQQNASSGDTKENATGSSSSALDSSNNILILRVPRQTIYKIYSRLMTADQREKFLLFKLPEFREHNMLRTLPLHPLQIHESWLFRGIDDTTLRMLTKTAVPFALTQGNMIAQKGKRLAHILFIQRGLVALRDEKQEIKTILGPGSVYGEREALFRERLTVSVVALTNVDVLALSLKTVQHQLSSSESAKSILNKNAAQRRQRDLHASFESSGGRLADSVRRTPLLPVPELAETLIPYLKPRVFSAGEHIVDSTAECDRIVYLTRGCAVVRGLKDESGGEVLFQRGECVGFTCMASHRWERTIVAAEPVDTWELSRSDFYKWLKRHTYFPSEEDLFYNKKFALAVKKVLPHIVIPGSKQNHHHQSSSPANNRRQSTVVGETKLIESSKQVISTMSDSVPLPSSKKKKNRVSPTRSSTSSPSYKKIESHHIGHAQSSSVTTTTTTSASAGALLVPSSSSSASYIGPSHILKDNGLVICQNEIDPRTNQPMRKFPHLYSLVVGRTLQLVQPFHLHPNQTRDERLDRYTMNPVMHFGEDLAVQRKKTGTANHGFISLKSGGNNKNNNNGIPSSSSNVRNVSFAGSDDNNNNSTQQDSGGGDLHKDHNDPLLDSSFADANLDDTAVFSSNNNNNDQQQHRLNLKHDDQKPVSMQQVDGMDASIIQSANDFQTIGTSEGLDEYEILVAQHRRHHAQHFHNNNNNNTSPDQSFVGDKSINDTSTTPVGAVAVSFHQQQESLLPSSIPTQRNTLPWLETPNLHPTSFEVGKSVFRPWIPPVRPSMILSSSKYFHHHHNHSEASNNRGNDDGDNMDDDEYDEDENVGHFNVEDVAAKKAGGRGMLINLARIREPKFDSSDDDDSQNDHDAENDMDNDVLTTQKSSSKPSEISSSSSPHRTRSSPSSLKSRRIKRRAQRLEAKALKALKESSAAIDASRPPMSTFTPSLTVQGDHNVDVFGTLTSHTYTFTPATQFEQIARHRAQLEKRLMLNGNSNLHNNASTIINKTKSSLISSSTSTAATLAAHNAEERRRLLLLMKSSSTMPTSQEALAAFYDSLDNEFDETGEFEQSPFGVEHCVVESDFADILYPSKIQARKRWKTVRTTVGVKDEEEHHKNLIETMKGMTDSELRKAKAAENLAQMSQAIRDSFFGRSVYHRNRSNTTTSNTSNTNNNNTGKDGKDSSSFPRSSSNRGAVDQLRSDDDDDFMIGDEVGDGSSFSIHHQQNHNRRNHYESSLIGRISSRPPLSQAVIDKCMKDHKQRIAGPRNQIIKLAKAPKNAVLRSMTPEAQHGSHQHRSTRSGSSMNPTEGHHQHLLAQQQQQQHQNHQNKHQQRLQDEQSSSLSLEPPSPLESQTTQQFIAINHRRQNNINGAVVVDGSAVSISAQASGDWTTREASSAATMLSQSQDDDDNILKGLVSHNQHQHQQHHHSTSANSGFDKLQQHSRVPVPPMLRHKAEQENQHQQQIFHRHRPETATAAAVNHQRKLNYDNTTQPSFVSDHLMRRPKWKPRPPHQSDFLEKHHEKELSLSSTATTTTTTANRPTSARNTASSSSQRFSRTVDFSAKRQEQDQQQQQKEKHSQYRRNNNNNNNTLPSSSTTLSTSRVRRFSNVTEIDNEWQKRNYMCLSAHATSASDMVGSLLLNWKQATQNSINRQQHENKKDKKSVLLQPRRQYQPEIDNPEFYYHEEEKNRRNRRSQRTKHYEHHLGNDDDDEDEDDIDETELLIN